MLGMKKRKNQYQIFAFVSKEFSLQQQLLFVYFPSPFLHLFSQWCKKSNNHSFDKKFTEFSEIIHPPSCVVCHLRAENRVEKCD